MSPSPEMHRIPLPIDNTHNSNRRRYFRETSEFEPIYYPFKEIKFSHEDCPITPKPTEYRTIFRTDDNKLIVAFLSNGEIEIGEGYTPTEAGDLFLLYVMENYKYLFPEYNK